MCQPTAYTFLLHSYEFARGSQSMETLPGRQDRKRERVVEQLHSQGHRKGELWLCVKRRIEADSRYVIRTKRQERIESTKKKRYAKEGGSFNLRGQLKNRMPNKWRGVFCGEGWKSGGPQDEAFPRTASFRGQLRQELLMSSCSITS